jgi:hypothetical protein
MSPDVIILSPTSCIKLYMLNTIQKGIGVELCNEPRQYHRIDLLALESFYMREVMDERAKIFGLE